MTFIYYNTKQPHNDFPMARITIFAIGKTLNDTKERKPWPGREETGQLSPPGSNLLYIIEQT